VHDVLGGAIETKLGYSLSQTNVQMFLHPDHEWALALGLTVTLTASALLVVFWPAVKQWLIKVLECAICKKAYEAAVELYLRAAVGEATDCIIKLERRKKAGKGIKAYFKDLWMAFIIYLVVSGSTRVSGQGPRQGGVSQLSFRSKLGTLCAPPPSNHCTPNVKTPDLGSGVPTGGSGASDNAVQALITMLCGCAVHCCRTPC
jgi:hypothetical protein